jgi:hypothetical protein
MTDPDMRHLHDQLKRIAHEIVDTRTREGQAVLAAADAIDALSARLALFEALTDSLELILFGDNQSRDRDELEARASELVAADARLAQAEQLAADMSNLVKIERAGREALQASADTVVLEARLREYEEALDKLVPDVRLLVTAYYSGTPDDLKAADAPASRLDAMLFDDDGAPRSVLAPKVADG